MGKLFVIQHITSLSPIGFCGTLNKIKILKLINRGIISQYLFIWVALGYSSVTYIANLHVTSQMKEALVGGFRDCYCYYSM